MIRSGFKKVSVKASASLPRWLLSSRCRLRGPIKARYTASVRCRDPMTLSKKVNKATRPKPYDKSKSSKKTETNHYLILWQFNKQMKTTVTTPKKHQRRLLPVFPHMEVSFIKFVSEEERPILVT